MLRRVVRVSTQVLSSRHLGSVQQDARCNLSYQIRVLSSLSSSSDREGSWGKWAFWLGLTGEAYPLSDFLD